MKLAQALNERKELQTRLDRLHDRLTANVRVQEGDTPSEDPVMLFGLLDETAEALQSLIFRIARTNIETIVEGRPLADWVAEREVAQRRFNILRNVLDTAARRTERHSATDIRILSTIDVAAHQKALDQLAVRIREIDATVQAANWTTDLL